MASYQERLEALKQKSARLRQSRLEAFKEKTVQLGSDLKKVTFEATKRMSVSAREAGSRLSISAKEASRRVSIRASRRMSMRTKSFLTDGKPDPEHSSSNEGSSGNRDPKHEDEADHFANDNVGNADAEEKEDEAVRLREGADILKALENASRPRLSTVPEKPKTQRMRPLNDKNWDPKTATSTRLHEALLAAKWDEAVWCVHKGVDVKKWKGILGETTLHEACMRRAPSKVVKAIIAAGADVNAASTIGLSPLHSACMYNPSATVIEVLIKAGSRINLQSKNGMTPLTSATMQGRAIEIIALLLRYGANPRIIGSNGKTCADYAQYNERIVSMLLNVLPLEAMVRFRPQLPKEVLVRVKGFLY